MEEFKSIVYAPDTLEVELYPCLICQYKCSFCYARRDYKKDWPKIMSINVLIKILDGLCECKYKVNLYVLGGEPTLYPYLDRIIGYSDRLHVHIISNGALDLSKLNVSNISFTLSYYPQYADTSLFIKNLDYLNEHSVVDVQITKFKNQNSDAVEKYCLDNNIPMDFVAITNRSDKIVNTGIKFNNSANHFLYNGQAMPVYAALNMGLSFKGWKCEQNSLLIDVNGNIFQGCKQTAHNILHEPDYLKSYTIEETTCQKDACQELFLSQRKYK